MKNRSYTVESKEAAWQKVNEIFPHDYMEDPESRERAGYPIYRSTAKSVKNSYYNYICDLGTSLEVNLCDENWNGETIRIRVEEPEQVETMSEDEIRTAVEATHSAQRMTVNALYAPTVCQKVTVCVMGGSFAANEDERRVYEALHRGQTGLEFEVLTRYCETHGVRWGSIGHTRVTRYDYSGAGHVVVEGYVTARIGEEMDFLAKCAALLRDEAEQNRA